MAYSQNKVLLIGNVGKDPDLREAGSSQVCKFTLATTKIYKDKSGEKQEKTEWHNIKAWGKVAEILGNHVQKGIKISLEGELETEKYTDKEGITRYQTWVVVSDFVFLQPKGARPEADDRPEADEKPDDGLPF